MSWWEWRWWRISLWGQEKWNGRLLPLVAIAIVLGAELLSLTGYYFSNSLGWLIIMSVIYLCLTAIMMRAINEYLDLWRRLDKLKFDGKEELILAVGFLVFCLNCVFGTRQPIYLAMILLCPICYDCFAYAIGRSWRKKPGGKIAPRISPHKSWAGTMGGIVLTGCLGLVLAFINERILGQNIITTAWNEVKNLGWGLIIGLSFGFWAGVTDFVLSWTKRYVAEERYKRHEFLLKVEKIEDYGDFFGARHGGCADRAGTWVTAQVFGLFLIIGRVFDLTWLLIGTLQMSLVIAIIITVGFLRDRELRFGSASD